MIISCPIEREFDILPWVILHILPWGREPHTRLGVDDSRCVYPYGCMTVLVCIFLLFLLLLLLHTHTHLILSCSRQKWPNCFSQMTCLFLRLGRTHYSTLNHVVPHSLSDDHGATDYIVEGICWKPGFLWVSSILLSSQGSLGLSEGAGVMLSSFALSTIMWKPILAGSQLHPSWRWESRCLDYGPTFFTV